ncbi:CaiB/BaiF CoA transferase family protein [Streptomyces albipurpureus]|uniref:CoA transferase n=1 Tax=Streptomyces albipurpureus TaxID=2897419 RepID=A0ABT0UU11_9ACTN|nr:CoA transferase [Streptomyces sp. CWNU-1]MCM2391877.1 CoA transferase [Streptomyces sp. CWNU-1]
MVEAQENPGLLRHVVVVETGARTAVAACGGLLAQLGAEVVLIEPAHPRADHKWTDRAATAAGKRSVVIDHRTPEGREIYAELMRTADVVLRSSDLDGETGRECYDEPHRHGGEEDADVSTATRPGHSARQISCDITAFGHNGPLAGVGGSEALVEAVTGVAETTGRRDGPPVLLGVPLLEMEAAVYAASAVIAALRARRLHGFGQRLDIALYDVAVNALAAFLPLPLTGRVATRNGNRHPTLSPWNSYSARDGWVVICAPTDEQWGRLCGVMARPELIHDPLFATTTQRMENVDAIDTAVGAWTVSRSVQECVDALTEAVIPSGPVVPLAELADEPNLRHRSMVRTAHDPGADRPVLLPGCPVRWRADTPPPRVPARDGDREHIRNLVVNPDAAPGQQQPAQTPWARPAGPDDLAGSTPPGPSAPARPLDGIRVIEIGMNTVGPLAGKQLGALGADVIKVEPPRGDSNRHNAPLRPDGQSYVFALLNTDKRGLVLDLRDEHDRQSLWDLLASADVLIENLKPGSLARLGYGPQQVRASLPHLVYCSINGFGHHTVYPGRPALDTVVQAMSGLMSTTVVEGVPTKAGISASDQLGGLFGMLGVLAAIEDRETHGGPGATLDLAMQDCTAWATHRSWNTPATSGSLIVAGEAGAVLDEGGRHTPIATVDEVLAQQQTTARNLIIERPTSDGDHWTVLGSPLRLESTPAEVRTVMPRLGFPDPGLLAEFGPRAGSASNSPAGRGR